MTTWTSLADSFDARQGLSRCRDGERGQSITCRSKAKYKNRKEMIGGGEMTEVRCRDTEGIDGHVGVYCTYGRDDGFGFGLHTAAECANSHYNTHTQSPL